MWNWRRWKEAYAGLTGRTKYRVNMFGRLVLIVEEAFDRSSTVMKVREYRWRDATLKDLDDMQYMLQKVENDLTSDVMDPFSVIAGIREFGLAADGSDLRDLEFIFSNLVQKKKREARSKKNANAS